MSSRPPAWAAQLTRGALDGGLTFRRDSRTVVRCISGFGARSPRSRRSLSAPPFAKSGACGSGMDGALAKTEGSGTGRIAGRHSTLSWNSLVRGERRRPSRIQTQRLPRL